MKGLHLRTVALVVQCNLLVLGVASFQIPAPNNDISIVGGQHQKFMMTRQFAAKRSNGNDDMLETNMEKNVNVGKNNDHTVMNRRIFMATAAAVTTSALVLGDIDPVTAATTTSSNINMPLLPWQASPVNKRSGVTVFDAEKAGYNVAFVTYLSRFLLNFDTNCQRYWFSGGNFPSRATAEEVEKIRYDQFAAFSASVEVGLIDYKNDGGQDGPRQLLQDLVRRYGTVPQQQQPSNEVEDSTNNSNNPGAASKERIAKAARRHIALMFALLEKNQPTQEVTKLLASVDNGSITRIELYNETMLSGYEVGTPPAVTFPPPQAGEGYNIAKGKVQLKPTGGILRVNIVDGGSGYSSSSPPVVTVSPPTTLNTIIGSGEGKAATVQAKVVKGSVESVRMVDPGVGYTEKELIRVTVAPPDKMGEAAIATAIVNMAVAAIEITKGGSGYAVEKPLKIFVAPPENAKKTTTISDPIVAGLAYPCAKKTSFTSFRKEDDVAKLNEEQTSFNKKFDLNNDAAVAAVRGITSGGAAPLLPFWSGRSASSTELLRLLPAGVGLEYDKSMKRYVLAMDTNFMNAYPAFLQQGSNRVIGTEFGPRGRAPIERDMVLDASAYLRFCLSGATCASLVHIALTPLDVAKTRLQTAPEKYPNIGTAFQLISKEEGLPTFFTGWLPTLLGNFLSGGVLYVTTEYMRRSLSEAAGVDAIALEVPIILAAAAVASSIGAVLICPFEAVRIRTVAQPDFAPNSIAVFKKMLKEEGPGSLLNAIPIFLVKNVPYAMTKFTIFDISTERLYEAFPAAQEDIKLSLLVSLVGGILGGTAAAVVSNPADAVISELKKTKSDISPQAAVATMLERNGISTFFVGLPLRMVFYSLVASMTFVAYDFVRILLKIGPDDLKLYMDVLASVKDR